MHILFVADGDSKYGASHSLLNLVTELMKADAGIEISVVVTMNSSNVVKLEETGCKVYRIPYQPFYQGIPDSKIKFGVKYIVRGIQYLYGRLFAIGKLEKQLNIKNIDIIHSNSSREDFGACLAKKYGIPLIWHIREYGDLDYSCYSYRKHYISFMNQNADIFIAVSNAVQKHWITKGIEKERIKTIYDGVCINAYLRKEKKFMILPNIKFVMIGSLNWTKGQYIVIEALALLPKSLKERVHLYIVGDGSTSYTKYLNTLICTNHLENQISLLGYQENFWQELYKYDCGLMCSKSEGFGRVTVEYMMAGLPVIASDSGANPELIEEGINGLLYRQDDSRALMEKMVYLMENTDEISRMGKNACDMARERYSARRNALNIYEEYKKILSKCR